MGWESVGVEARDTMSHNFDGGINAFPPNLFHTPMYVTVLP